MRCGVKIHAFASGDELEARMCRNEAVQCWRTEQGKVLGFCEEHKVKGALARGWKLLSKEVLSKEEASLDPTATDQFWWAMIVTPAQGGWAFRERVFQNKHPFEYLAENHPNGVLLGWKPISQEEAELYVKLFGNRLRDEGK